MKWKLFLLSILYVTTLSACGNDDNNTTQSNPTYDMSGFAKGADVSWLTEMEAANVKFYDANGSQTECLSLLRSMGINSIRLRVWVNPSDGWNNKLDVIAKALRAKNLGFRVMIDFHYSDTWADPGKQIIPAAWENYSLEEMKNAVANHTKDVLQALKDKGIDVEWVQVGNETATGMLWEIGRYSDSDKSSFAQLVTAGYDAAKAVFPNTKVIVHIDQGDKLDRFTWVFDGLKANGGKWDVIGMSLYPEDNNWEQATSDCLANIKALSQRYGCKVIVAEVGMPWDSKNAEAFMNRIVTGSKAISTCLGVFYWEPQCYGGWKGYTKGAFGNDGKPTSALNIFRNLK